jgi:hypothetical protein
MTKSELWQIYIDRNPELLEDGARLSKRCIMQFFETTWNAAYTEGRRSTERPNKTPMDILTDIFGTDPRK